MAAPAAEAPASARPRHRCGVRSAHLALLALASLAWLGTAEASARLPSPAPFEVLGAGVLRTPPVDAVPLCVPSSFGKPLVQRAQAASEFPASARELAGAIEADSREAGSEAALLVALLSARGADTPEAYRAARSGLGPWRRRDRGPERRACAHLETARLELRLRRLPEAVAHARIAGGLSGRIPDGGPIHRAADFYAAEGLYLSGREKQARADYRRLSASASPRISAAARLRFADALFDSGQREGAQIEYAELLDRAETFGASIRGWGLRALEATLERGDLDEAKRWAEAILVADPKPEVRGATRIRVADMLAARGDHGAARRLLEQIAEDGEPEKIRTLARLRIEHADSSPADAERVERLRALSRDPWRPAADYARLLLARDLMQLDDAAGAVDALSRVAFGPVADRLSTPLRETLDEVLAALAESASDPAGCADYVATIGWRRKLLAQRASEVEPFAHLGRCYALLGLEQVAIAVYREVSRRFGREGAEQVALPLARALLSRGEVEAARRKAIEHVNDEGERGSGWRLLHSEIEMFEGRYGAAAETLRGLVERDLPVDERARAIVLLARAASHLARLAELRFVIGDAIVRLEAEERGRHAAWVGEAALLAADGHRDAGNLREARDLYRVASESLPAGARRDQARYWLSELGEVADEQADRRRPSSWQRLAETRRRLDTLTRRTEGAAQRSRTP